MFTIAIALAVLTTSAKAEERHHWDEEAFPAAESVEYHREMRRISEATAEAADELPYCERLERISNAVFRVAPPTDECPVTHREFEHLRDHDSHLRENCRELMSLMDHRLHDEYVAGDAEGLRKTKERIEELRHESRERSWENEGAWARRNDLSEEEIPAREGKDVRCVIANSSIRHYRKHALRISEDHYEVALSTLDDRAQGRFEASENYLRFLRYGIR